jgi:hypothetical protein
MTPTIGDTLFTKKTAEDKGLQSAIDAVLYAMQTFDPSSDDYAKLLKQLSKLYKLKEPPAPTRVSPDTLALVLGNLAGVLLIVTYEKHNIVTSKALTFVQKLR